MLFLIFILVGALAGSLSGLIGIGGGVVVVPMLVTVFHFRGFPDDMVMHFAAGTSLAVMIITTSASLHAHLKTGQNIWPIFKKIMPGVALGTITGAVVADFLHSEILEVIFGFMLLFVAYKVFSAPKREASGNIPMVNLCVLGSDLADLRLQPQSTQ